MPAMVVHYATLLFEHVRGSLPTNIERRITQNFFRNYNPGQINDARFLTEIVVADLLPDTMPAPERIEYLGPQLGQNRPVTHPSNILMQDWLHNKSNFRTESPKRSVLIENHILDCETCRPYCEVVLRYRPDNTSNQKLADFTHDVLERESNLTSGRLLACPFDPKYDISAHTFDESVALVKNLLITRTLGNLPKHLYTERYVPGTMLRALNQEIELHRQGNPDSRI